MLDLVFVLTFTVGLGLALVAVFGLGLEIDFGILLTTGFTIVLTGVCLCDLEDLLTRLEREKVAPADGRLGLLISLMKIVAVLSLAPFRQAEYS